MKNRALLTTLLYLGIPLGIQTAQADPAAPAAAAAAPAAEENKIKMEEDKPDAVESLKAKGVAHCGKALRETIKYLYPGGLYSYLNTWNMSAPDKHMTHTILSQAFEDGTVWSSVAVSSNQSGGCDAAFTQTISLTGSCTKVRETAFKEWEYSGELSGASLYETKPKDTLTVALSPQQGSCLVVKTGLLFFPADAEN